MADGIYKKLFDAMKVMENPIKEKQAYKYKYETLEQVLGIIRPALAENGLMLTQCQRETEYDDKWVLETWVFDENGEKLLMDTRHIPVCSDAQQAGSWETYERRYALRTAFGLTGEDDDGAATKGKTGGRASGRTMDQLDSKINEFAKMKGKTFEEVRDALIASKPMNGAKGYGALTQTEAETALCVMVKWIGESV